MKKNDQETCCDMDVVYVLGSGSNWNNNELRFSLRSIEKNLSGYRNIYVVGEDPGFTKDVILIPYPDEIGPHNADGNIIRKVIRACNEDNLSDDFVYMNDDEYFLRPLHTSEIYPIHKGDMNTFADSYFERNYWRSRLLRTREHLNMARLSALHFDHHAPMIFNKHRFPDIVDRFDYASDVGLTIKSLYGNVMHPDAKPNEWEKVRIFKHLTLARIQHDLSQALYLTINDFGLNNSMKYFLALTFPEPSKYENNAIEDRIIEIAQWLNGQRNYQEGVRLFIKYGRQVALAKHMRDHHTPQLERKLTFKLENFIREL